MDSSEQALELLRIAVKEITQAIREEHQSVHSELARIADHFDPPPADLVGTDYVAKKLGYKLDYVGEMARDGVIPDACKVPGTGHGKKWQFYRKRIDRWIDSR